MNVKHYILPALSDWKTLRIVGWMAVSIMQCISPAHAHMYWMQPNHFYFYDEGAAAEKELKLTFEFSGGDECCHPDDNRIAQGGTYQFDLLTPKGEAIQGVSNYRGKTREVMEAKISEPGTYVLAVARVGEPMYYTELPNQVYIPKADDELTPEEKRVAIRSVGYYQYAKAYTTVKAPSASWQKTIGHMLEIVPLAHPNLVYAGNRFPVRLMFNGAPLPGARLKVVYEGFRPAKHGEALLEAVTDEKGETTIAFTDARRWLITAEYEGPSENKAKASSNNYRTSLMLAVEDEWVKTLTR